MSTIGIDCRFEPEKPLEYTPAKLDKLINAALKAKPPYKTTYAWDWPLQNIEFELDFDGTIKSLPMEGLLINDIVQRTYVSTTGDWKPIVAKFLSSEVVKRSADFEKRLRVHQYLEQKDLLKGVSKSKTANLNVFVDFYCAVGDAPATRLTLRFSTVKPSDWAKGVVMNLNPKWKLVPADLKKTRNFFLIREGNAEVGKWEYSGKVVIGPSSCTPEQAVDFIERWNKAVQAPDSLPLACEVWMDNLEREKDQAAEYAKGLSQAPDGHSTWMRIQYAVMSHDGIASLKQWPARKDGRELESSVCYFERNRRERAAISVATGPKGQYIFFTSVQSTMQAELEKLFGLKLKRVKVKKG